MSVQVKSKHFYSTPVYARLTKGYLKERKKEERKKKTTQAAKSSSHQLRKRGHLGRKAPSPEKKRAISEDQEGCGQTSQQTSPDWFEGEENAQENVSSEQAYEQ